MRAGGTAAVTLPWREVNALPGMAVAEALVRDGCALTPARERCKWACPAPSCESSDAFHTFAQAGRRSRCYSCGLVLTNVDFAALLRGQEPRDALRWLAGQFGIYVPPWDGRTGPSPAPAVPLLRTASRSLIAQPDEAMAALLALPDPVLPEVLYADLLALLELTALGARYLRSRGIPPAFAAELGFRSVDGPSGWARVRRHLKESYRPETLRAAGFPVQENGRVWTPFGGVLPMLVIPFLHRGKPVYLRMRTIGPPPPRLRESFPAWSAHRNRYRSPKDVVPRLPYGADALGREVVHVVEGEINAATLSLPEYGQHAVGLPGAWSWDASWAGLLGEAFRVVLWYDPDDAGTNARAHARDSLRAAHGDLWVRARVRDMALSNETDINDLHLAGSLAPVVRDAPWMHPAAPAPPQEHAT
jgi:hypothetical protein